MDFLKGFKSFLKQHFSSTSQSDVESGLVKNVVSEVDVDVSQEEGVFLEYADAQKVRGSPEVLQLDSIQGDTMADSLKLCNLMKSDVSDGIMDVGFERFTAMHNENVDYAIIGLLVKKPDYLEAGVHAMKDNVAMTWERFSKSMVTLATNMPDDIHSIMGILVDMNDISSADALGKIALNFPEHTDLAIEHLQQMRILDGVGEQDDTLADLEVGDIIEVLEENKSHHGNLENLMGDSGISFSNG